MPNTKNGIKQIRSLEQLGAITKNRLEALSNQPPTQTPPEPQNKATPGKEPRYYRKKDIN